MQPEKSLSILSSPAFNVLDGGFCFTPRRCLVGSRSSIERLLSTALQFPITSDMSEDFVLNGDRFDCHTDRRSWASGDLQVALFKPAFSFE